MLPEIGFSCLNISKQVVIVTSNPNPYQIAKPLSAEARGVFKKFVSDLIL
jgi:hypothetical protein